MVDFDLRFDSSSNQGSTESQLLLPLEPEGIDPNLGRAPKIRQHRSHDVFLASLGLKPLLNHPPSPALGRHGGIVGVGQGYVEASHPECRGR